MAPTRKEIEPAIWTVLLQSIRAGRCVPFLGAAANIGCGGTKIPTGIELALQIAGAMTGVAIESLDELVTVEAKHPVLKDRKELVRLDLSELARISLYYRDQLGAKDFLDDVRARIIHEASDPSRLMGVLAKLPFKLIVTTNYDHMMERALKGRPYLSVVQPVCGFDEKIGRQINDKLTTFDGVRLYKLHGEFAPLQPSASQDVDDAQPCEYDAPVAAFLKNGEVSPIIITEEDYIQFLTILREPHKGVPKWIQSQIRQSRFLFLGYGLDDWDFRTLFEGLIAPIPKYLKPTSYAIQWDPPQFWVDYWEGRGVRIYEMDIRVFAEQLEEKYVAKYGEPLPAGS